MKTREIQRSTGELLKRRRRRKESRREVEEKVKNLGRTWVWRQRK